jgi:hypothetical protein
VQVSLLDGSCRALLRTGPGDECFPNLPWGISRGRDRHKGLVLAFLPCDLPRFRGNSLLFPLVVSNCLKTLQTYFVLVSGVFRHWYAIRTLVPRFQTNVPGGKPVGRTENLTPALLGMRGLSRAHKVLANGLELVARVPTARVGGPSLHANCLGTCVTWKEPRTVPGPSREVPNGTSRYISIYWEGRERVSSGIFRAC